MWTFPDYTPHRPLDWAQLTRRYAWLDEMRHVPQDPEWHGEGDVLTHTQMVVDELFRLPEFAELSPQNQHILFTAALLHDVEKRSTTREEIIDGKTRIVSPRHAQKGELTARQILYRDIATPFAVREQICKLVRLHGLPLWAISKPDPERAVIAASLGVDTRLLAMLARADVLGRICPDKDEILLRIDLFEEMCQELDCWGKPRAFATDNACYHYLNQGGSADYVPYDDFACEVVMMCALAGSGKDSFIHKHLSHLPMISLDDIRRTHKLNPADSHDTAEAVRIGKELAKQYLREKRSFVFNATNLNRDLRSKWTGIFAAYGAKIKIVYLEVPHSQWLAQNKQREHSVPEKVLTQMLGKWEVPSFDEAHEIVFQAA
ncbi:AAA family ATPase [Wielerella bovis]|uniref:AAA family ATPase n=1 Tax=Wielerella bovis TaxID=2917790 RepID=UPI002018B8AC|nr:AAA family ATPase [Wielerella bovis]ULJ64753.1 AAA family ATPase [Wielerella bovis]ULJ67025.1 AAA family ATPase [Wielerella bovis]